MSILGDNFFYGQSLSKCFQNVKLKNGAKIVLHKVVNPEKFGIATVKNKKILSLKEKPKVSKSNLAVTGLYFFDNKVIKYVNKLKPSNRNELEIVDLLNEYKKNNKLTAEFIGGKAVDTGSIEDFIKLATLCQRNQQGFKIVCIEEIALNNNWINKKKIKTQLNSMEIVNIQHI